MTTRKNNGILKLSKKRGISVTVCVATIYSDESIFGISDRMLTSGTGDIEFEPDTRKIFVLTRCIAIMTAGDSSIQAQLVAGITDYVNERVENAPNDWIKVGEVAAKYKELYIDLRKKRAEAAILAPHDLTYKSFIEKQKMMSDDFVSNLSYKLENFRLEESENVATIITGIDRSGPHIYVVHNDYLACNDRVGFAAVGIGASHVQSQLMNVGYSRQSDEANALLMIHRAKKKSEISPGVGNASDIFGIFSEEDGVPGSFRWLEGIKEGMTADLDGFYGKYVERNREADLGDAAEVRTYLQEVVTQIASNQQEASPEEVINPADKPTESDKVKGNHEKKESPRRTRRKTD